MLHVGEIYGPEQDCHIDIGDSQMGRYIVEINGLALKNTRKQQLKVRNRKKSYNHTKHLLMVSVGVCMSVCIALHW